MKYFKIINTQSKPYKELFVTATSTAHVEAWVIKNMPDWYFGMNVIEVNADKTRKQRGDFSCVAVRRYFVETMGTNNDTDILKIEYSHLIRRINGDAWVREQLLNMCYAYDPFPEYIESYKQQKQAEAKNKKLDARFNLFVQYVRPGYNHGVPMHLQNAGEQLEQKLDKWLSKGRD